MRYQFLGKNFALIAAIVVLFIVYGTLYPFVFHRGVLSDDVRALIAGWAKRPGKGDFLSNILLYMPLGYFVLLAIPARVGTPLRIGLTVLSGLSLSTCLELTQYFESARDSEATDIYANTIGSVIGAAGAFGFGGERLKKLRLSWADPAALMLLTAWAGYNLYPFEPVIDLKKYWSAVKPLLQHPLPGWYALFTHVAVWMAVALLIDDATTKGGSREKFAAFAAFLLGAKIVLDGGTLSAAEIAGAAVALIWRIGLEPWPRLRMLSAAALLACSIVAQRLEPFHFQAKARAFGWIPFYSFMNGSIQVDMLSFLEKSFLYGSLVWLLQKAGLRLSYATLAVAALLLATSWAEIHLPGRSAEITDAVIALFAGSLIALVRPAPTEVRSGVAPDGT